MGYVWSVPAIWIFMQTNPGAESTSRRTSNHQTHQPSTIRLDRCLSDCWDDGDRGTNVVVRFWLKAVAHLQCAAVYASV